MSVHHGGNVRDILSACRITVEHMVNQRRAGQLRARLGRAAGEDGDIAVTATQCFNDNPLPARASDPLIEAADAATRLVRELQLHQVPQLEEERAAGARPSFDSA